MPKRFHYVHDGVQSGPIEGRELKALAAGGQLLPTDLVWPEGAPDWVAASTVQGLFPPAAPTVGSRLPHELPPPLPQGNKQPAAQKAAEFREQALREAKATARATTEQVTRLVGLGTSRLKEQRQRKESAAALIAFGERLYEQGLGDGALQTKIAAADEEIDGLKLTNASTREAEAQRRRLCAQLAEPFVNGPAPSGLEAEHAAVAAARQAEQQVHQDVERSQQGLVPNDADNRRRVLIGAAVLGVLLLVGGAVFLSVASRLLGIGGGDHPSILLGEWKGKTTWFLEFTTEFDFRSNGRVFWHQDFGAMGQNDGSGTWKVTRVEGDRYSIEMHNDLDPDEAYGWVIVFNGDDQFTISGYDDIPITVQRVD